MSGIGKVADKIPAGANAQGLIKDEEEITINIPAGARDGIQLNVRGKGNDAPFGGTPGDLLVIIEEEVDQTIKREGDNLHQELYISFAEAALGTKKEIPTVGGKVKITVDPGTQSGKILRLAGKGLQVLTAMEKVICLFISMSGLHKSLQKSKKTSSKIRCPAEKWLQNRPERKKLF